MIPEHLTREVRDHLNEHLENVDEFLHETSFNEDIYLFEEMGADQDLMDYIDFHFANTDDREGIKPDDHEEALEWVYNEADEYFRENPWDEQKTVRENLEDFHRVLPQTPESRCPIAWNINGSWYYTEQAYDVLKEMQAESETA